MPVAGGVRMRLPREPFLAFQCSKPGQWHSGPFSATFTSYAACPRSACGSGTLAGQPKRRVYQLARGEAEDLLGTKLCPAVGRRGGAAAAGGDSRAEGGRALNAVPPLDQVTRRAVCARRSAPPTHGAHFRQSASDTSTSARKLNSPAREVRHTAAHMTDAPPIRSPAPTPVRGWRATAPSPGPVARSAHRPQTALLRSFASAVSCSARGRARPRRGW